MQNPRPRRLRASSVALLSLALLTSGLAIVPLAAAEDCDDGGTFERVGCKVDDTISIGGGAVWDIVCVWVSCPILGPIETIVDTAAA